ncbi:MAG: hypothetical protein HYR85_12355 [Planctomycetes bacterium]|nr:hypothetical protein [Planctomycetota bacterium]MBI3846370.1 hypothetical protein [Planctomycetota bacterium]
MADSPCWFAVTGPRMNIGIRSAEESRDAVVRFWRKQSVRFSIVDTNDHPLAKTKVGVEIVLPPEWRRIQRERHPPLGAPGSALWWEGQTADSDRWIVLWALNAQSQTTDDNGEVTLVVPKGEPTWIGFNRSDLLPRDIRNGSLGFAVRADVRPTPVASPPVRVVVPACSIEKPSLEGTVRGPSIRADHVMAVGDSMWVSAPLLRMPSKHDGFEGSFVFFGLLPGTYTLRVGEYRDREVTVAEQHIEFPGTPMTVDIPIPSTDR